MTWLDDRIKRNPPRRIENAKHVALAMFDDNSIEAWVMPNNNRPIDVCILLHTPALTKNHARTVLHDANELAWMWAAACGVEVKYYERAKDMLGV